MNTYEQLKNLEWLEPWTAASDAELEAELKREVGKQHPLYEQEAVCVGRRVDNDEVLFYLPDAVVPLAVVTLNRRVRGESEELPATNFYYSVEDFINERLKPDHTDFTRGAIDTNLREAADNQVVNQPLKENMSDTARRSGIAYAAVLALVMAVVVCLVAGLLADRYFGTSYGVIIGILVGAVVGFYQFIRMMNRVK